ncbi:MAG TPA: hypothetical protein VFE44_06760, partial [Thermoanaerobaculia bacterium]|nr:hypothetical protein [Thermoanaerobaculia bacterium]
MRRFPHLPLLASLVTLAVVATEMAAFLALWMSTGGAPTSRRWRAALAGAQSDLASPLPGVTQAATGRPRAWRHQAVHPFLGFVEEPDRSGRPADQTVDELGFVIRRSGRPASAETPFIVGVFGGSVAQMLVLLTGDELERELRRLPVVAGRPVVVRAFALGGFKQPQQLMALNYLLVLEQRLDLVIVLDGFNDVVLPVVENLRIGLHPFYPRGWPDRVRPPDIDRLRRVGELAHLRVRRRESAAAFDRPLVLWSPTAQLVWRHRDSGLAARIARLEREIATLARPRRSYALHGPAYRASKDDALYRNLAAFWGRCSLLMHEICAAEGILYFHFRQPNQYVAGAKAFTRQERRIALERSEFYGPPAREGYRFLIAAGEELRARGVSQHDLTRIFADVEEP